MESSTTSPSRPYDTCIIGGGAAGLSAALMLGRAQRRILVVDTGQPRNRAAHTVNATLGLVDTSPMELLRRGREQLSPYDVDFRDDAVVQVRDADDGLSITLESGVIERARTILVATGITDILPQVAGLSAWWGDTVFHCPYCHGWEVRGEKLGVLVSSPAGFHQAAMARQWSEDVTVFFTDDAPSMQPEERARLQARGVNFATSPVREAVGGESLEALRTTDGRKHAIQALLVAPSSKPNDRFLDSLDLLRNETPAGSFLAVDEVKRTSHPRIWAAGNVIDPNLNVPLAMGQATGTGAAINFALIEEDMNRAAQG